MKKIKNKPIDSFWKPLPLKKKDMNWKQAKKAYPKLKPLGDWDKDGVKNKKDCKPFDKTRHAEFFTLTPEKRRKQYQQLKKAGVPTELAMRMKDWRPMNVERVIQGTRGTAEIRMKKQQQEITGYKISGTLRKYRRERKKLRRQRDPEALREEHRRYYAKYPGKIKEQGKKYRAKMKEMKFQQKALDEAWKDWKAKEAEKKLEPYLRTNAYRNGTTKEAKVQNLFENSNSRVEKRGKAAVKKRKEIYERQEAYEDKTEKLNKHLEELNSERQKRIKVVKLAEIDEGLQKIQAEEDEIVEEIKEYEKIPIKSRDRKEEMENETYEEEY